MRKVFKKSQFVFIFVKLSHTIQCNAKTYQIINRDVWNATTM